MNLKLFLLLEQDRGARFKLIRQFNVGLEGKGYHASRRMNAGKWLRRVIRRPESISLRRTLIPCDQVPYLDLPCSSLNHDEPASHGLGGRSGLAPIKNGGGRRRGLCPRFSRHARRDGGGAGSKRATCGRRDGGVHAPDDGAWRRVRVGRPLGNHRYTGRRVGRCMGNAVEPHGGTVRSSRDGGKGTSARRDQREAVFVRVAAVVFVGEESRRRRRSRGVMDSTGGSGGRRRCWICSQGRVWHQQRDVGSPRRVDRHRYRHSDRHADHQRGAAVIPCGTPSQSVGGARGSSRDFSLSCCRPHSRSPRRSRGLNRSRDLN